MLLLHQYRELGQMFSSRKDSFPMELGSGVNDGFAIHQICLFPSEGPRNKPFHTQRQIRRKV